MVGVRFASLLGPASVLALGGQRAGELERHARKAVALAQVAHDVLLLSSKNGLLHLRHLFRLVVLGDGIHTVKLHKAPNPGLKSVDATCRHRDEDLTGFHARIKPYRLS